MLARLLLSALAALALISGAAAQTGCSSSSVVEDCSATLTSNDGSGTATLTLGFAYCAPSVGYGSGPISTLQTGTLTVNDGSLAGISSFKVTALTGSITSGAPGSTSFRAPILSFASAASGTDSAEAAKMVINGETVSLGSNAPDVNTAGVTIPFSKLPTSLQSFASVSVACSAHASA